MGLVFGHIDPGDGRARAPRLPVDPPAGVHPQGDGALGDRAGRPLVDRLIDGFVDDGRADLVRELLFPFPLAVIAALLGLPDEDLPRFHRLAVELIGVSVDLDRAVAASAELKRVLRGDPRAAPSRAAATT